MNRIIYDKKDKGIDLLVNEDITIFIAKRGEEKLTKDIFEKYNRKINNKGIVAIITESENFEKDKELILNNLDINEKILVFSKDENKIIYTTYNVEKMKEVIKLLKIIDEMINKKSNTLLELLNKDKIDDLDNFTIITPDETYYKRIISYLKYCEYKFMQIELI